MKHLLKTSPTYKVMGKDYNVKLVHFLKIGSRFIFTAEITEGLNKGKWVSVDKSELKVLTR